MQPLLILKKCNPKSIDSLDLDLTSDKVENLSDYIAYLSDVKKLTGLLTTVPSNENIELYEAIYQLTQLKRLDLVDNNGPRNELDIFDRLTRLKNLTELGITSDTPLELLPVEKLTHLKTLKLSFSDNVDDDFLERALTLTKLEFLDLTWCQKITNDSFSKIVDMTNLTKLDLSRCLDILGRSFELLKALPRLWTLDLSYHHTLSTKEIQTISEYQHLTCLYLVSNNGLPGEGFQYISQMTNLKELHLEGRDYSALPLTALTNLRVLVTGVTVDRPCIAQLTSLRELTIHSTQTEDLPWLTTMTWLQELHITVNSVTPRPLTSEDAKLLTRALPNVLVTLPPKLKL